MLDNSHFPTFLAVRIPPTHLVIMTGALAVFCECLQSLVDEGDVVLVDVETQQAQASGCGAADTVQEHQSLRHQVVIALVVLISQSILKQEFVVNDVYGSRDFIQKQRIQPF